MSRMRHFSVEFKKEAMGLILEGCSAAQLAGELGVDDNLLY